MRSTNEDDAFDPRIGLKIVARTIKLSLEFWRKCFSRFAPRAFSHIALVTRNHLHASKHPAHTVADNDVRAMVRIKFIDFGQFFAQS